MAIQHSKTITEINVLNSGDKDVVCKVEYRFISFDDSDQDLTTIDSFKNFELSTDGRTSASAGWVAYASLTQAIIDSWLGSELTTVESSVQSRHEAWINLRLNPPAPATIDKALPW